MRTLNRNKKPLKYANVIERDKGLVTDSHGNILLSGDREKVWSEPIDFKANIVMNGGNAEAVEYGLDLSKYNAVIVTAKNEVPLKEGSLIWDTTEPKTDRTGSAVESSADYVVVKVSPTINVDRYILKKRVN